MERNGSFSTLGQKETRQDPNDSSDALGDSQGFQAGGAGPKQQQRRVVGQPARTHQVPTLVRADGGARTLGGTLGRKQ
ncbi:hypothetical protein GGTG_05959 [Gaeumannomyces tritici R3-111a-1]|uniref:Uncharacterized protein n=1 Tax=Gaeumannomyces tritici (strain R3-111a-1) TaxID=644352 RepID=J3NXF3_GAET3|nr:hypothetical protein GGTG_05959 [Gaeumannomyces tritici R3-111a-1]EJT76035.1 hypothetical protein GGTG_05959 [Gaeumannomyces tritici R3-111a-1]